MRRGTTPTFCCLLPADTSMFSQINAYFYLSNNTMVTKSKSDMTCNGREIEFSLSTTETSRFPEGSKVKLQIKLQTSDGKVMVSDIRTITVRTNLADYA